METWVIWILMAVGMIAVNVYTAVRSAKHPKKELHSEEVKEQPDDGVNAETVVGIGWVVALFFAARAVAQHVLLWFIYGFAKVHWNNLYFVRVGHGEAWEVSNGDLISEANFLCYLIVVGTWLSMAILTYQTVYNFVRKLIRQSAVPKVADP